MKKSLLLVVALFSMHGAFSFSRKINPQKLSKDQALLMLESTQPNAFKKVFPGNLFTDSVYVKMAREGWTASEIIRLTDEYLAAHKPELKKDGLAYDYKMHFRPYTVSSGLMNSSLIAYTNPKVLEKSKQNVLATQAGANDYYPRIFYTPTNRLAGVRNTGYFRHNAIFPSGGRISWLTLHPDDPNKLMVIPDGGGIFRTDDMGKHWDCITERIPHRYDRNGAGGYSIPVDPNNWNHIYAFMANKTVYKTFDGGQTWSKVIGATHKDFKRGYCFRDAAGKLKFIGATRAGGAGVGAILWTSSDTCKTWKSFVPTTVQTDKTTASGVKTFWFQEVEFHPTNRDIIYATGSRGIMKSADGGTTWNRMIFTVYGATTATLRVANTDLFPLATADGPMFLTINPNNGNEMWAALSTRATATSTALYKTTDGGATWITLQEPTAGIGSGGLFGNESAWEWLGGFAVNFTDPKYVYGCVMNSSESTNGGVNFTQYDWWLRHTGFYPDGNIYDVSSASHNADNHVLKGHKSGRIFRGCDAGLIMKDPAINGYKWTNINGDMGNMLFYALATNEFGEFSLAANTQDINIQFYRGGRWGKSRGYEGSTVWINPYSGEEHYTNTNSVKTTNLEYSSWCTAHTKADVCTGYWYIRRDGNNPDGSRFSIVKDGGKTAIALDNAALGFVVDFALSRDVPGGKLFVLRADKRAYVSTDNGKTYTFISSSNTCSATKIAVNPDNSNEIYLARAGVVYRTLNGGSNWTVISTAALSGMDISDLLYHEGSGDLYYVSPTHGIFIQEAGKTDWVLWSKGYNTAKLGSAIINYTTQEMIISDYGTGTYIADLQHPADRYLKNGFSLKQLSNENNARTFGINIHYTIPLYYYYKWYVNGVLQANENGQYFTSSTLQPNDKVKLVVTLRESPDVSSTSADFTVASETTTIVANKRGNYLYSNQRGKVDLGYVDHFFGNFTLQMWINPKSDGVILANRQTDNQNSVKGFYFSVASGKLKFNYAPQNSILQPYNETTQTYEYAIDAGALNMNAWNQVTLTHNRTGNICIYVNGVLKATQVRTLQSNTLNNSMYLSLFADGYEMNPIDASVDELKIWNDVLDQTTVRKSMFGEINSDNVKQIYYNDFNAATLDTQKERYSQKGMSPKISAIVEVKKSVIGVCATDNDYKTVGTTWTAFANKGVTALEIKSSVSTFAPAVSGLFYDQDIMGVGTNLPATYYAIYPTSFGVKMFDVTDLTKTVDLKFWLNASQADAYQSAKLYSLDLTALNETWVVFTAVTPVYNATEKSFTITGVKASDINNKRFVLVNVQPSVEFGSSSVNADNELNVYTPDAFAMPFQAKVVGGLQAPTSYSVTANSSFVKSIAPLTFVNDAATTTAQVAIDDSGIFNQKTPITITGEDAKLMPYTFNTVNKITAKTNSNGIKFNLGAGNIGSGTTYASLNGKNTATFMTWVRLDNATMLTGYRMLLFFRGTGTNATGLVLKDGKVGCHWNDEGWSWDVNSGLTLTTADIGKWVHIAMTVSPSGLNFYLNGKKGLLVGSEINPTTIATGLMIGKNYDGDANFIGAFDQVAIWNRTLTANEIVKYMHSRTYLNDAGLITYAMFDKEESTGGFIDQKSNLLASFNGVVTKSEAVNFPYGYEAQQVRTRAANNGILANGVAFTLPTTYPSAYEYYTSSFKGLPYNCVDTKYPKQVALESGFRTISFGNIANFSTGQNVQLSVENPAINAGDSVIFYARSLGSTAAFNIRNSVLAEAGKANFTIPGTVFNENLTYMFYRLPAANTAVNELNAYHYKVSVGNGICTVHNLRGNATVSILDMSGHVIAVKHTQDAVGSFELLSGAYILKIEEKGTACMTKIVL